VLTSSPSFGRNLLAKILEKSFALVKMIKVDYLFV
jgi:hypothetical protein